MAALTTEKRSTRRGQELGDSQYPLGVKAATTIYMGAGVVNDGGVMAPARTATGLITMGIARETYDNAGGAANKIVGEARGGTYLFNNSAGGDAIAVGDIGADAYWVDDQTVAKVATGRSRAGNIVDVVAEGVFVRVGLGY
jgi:hypothetical protein